MDKNELTQILNGDILNETITPSKIVTAPILLSDCPSRITIDEKDKYDIEIEAGEYLIVVMGFGVDKGASRFQHPNIVASYKKIHEFKHYRKNGSKFWTSQAGVNHVFVIPRNKITIIPEKGYSYIKAEINGVKVSFSVSGGTCSGGWADYLNIMTHTCINHKLEDVKKIAEVSVRNSPLEPIKTNELDTNELERWNKLADKFDNKKKKEIKNIKEKIAKMVEENKQPYLVMNKGFTIDKGLAINVNRKLKKFKTDREGVWDWVWSGSPKNFTINVGWNRYKVKVSQIDWDKTAQENKIA
jgi:hypothetical protein